MQNTDADKLWISLACHGSIWVGVYQLADNTARLAWSIDDGVTWYTVGYPGDYAVTPLAVNLIDGRLVLSSAVPELTEVITRPIADIDSNFQYNYSPILEDGILESVVDEPAPVVAYFSPPNGASIRTFRVRITGNTSTLPTKPHVTLFKQNFLTGANTSIAQALDPSTTNGQYILSHEIENTPAEDLVIVDNDTYIYKLVFVGEKGSDATAGMKLELFSYDYTLPGQPRSVLLSFSLRSDFV